MSKYLLQQYVYFCEPEDGVVFLNLRKGTYLGLGVNARCALRSIVRGWRAVDDATLDGDPENTNDGTVLADELFRRGLLTRDEALGKDAAPSSLRIADAIAYEGRTGGEPRVQFAHFTNFLAACAVARLRLRLCSMETIARSVRERIEHKRHDPLPRGEGKARELVRIFRRLRPLLYSAKDACLFDSLALVEFLLRYHVVPTWVIAVRTRPFQAHSWVQLDDLVLNETVDKARRFSPILVVQP